LSLSGAKWIQSTSAHYNSLRYILILSSYQCLGLPGGCFIHSGFPTKYLYAFLFLSHACCIHRPYHHPWFYPRNSNWRGAHIMYSISPLYSSLQTAVRVLDIDQGSGHFDPFFFLWFYQPLWEGRSLVAKHATMVFMLKLLRLLHKANDLDLSASRRVIFILYVRK
jgi:hypothetical protein